MSHFVYILQSETTKHYYVGSTHDVELRLSRHNEGWTQSTRGRGPWKVAYIERYESTSEALKREREIKRRKSKGYLEKLIHAEGRPVP